MHGPFVKKAEYIFNTFFRTLGIKPNNLISYGEKGAVTIAEGRTEYFESFTPYDISNVRYFIWKGKRLPILFYADFKEETDLFNQVIKTNVLPVDIIASSFFFLSCWQEITCSVKDKFGRFPYSESVQYKLGITTFPIVNEYMNIFLDLLRIANPHIQWNPLWPDNKKFAVCLTHDIDDIKRWSKANYREELKTIIRTKRINLASDYWVFKKICKEEEKRGFRSSFYFLTSKYSLTNLHFFRLFKQLRINGWEIGLHSITNTAKLLQNEKKALETVAGDKLLGVRAHWLKFNVPQFFSELEITGIKYDSSLGFAEHEGYRIGWAFPYYPYDPKKDRPFNVLEFPLNIMDTSLISHQRLNWREIWQRVEQLLRTTLNYRGCLVILWHESSFTNPVYTNLWIRVLDWIKRNDGIGLSAKQLFDWWTKKQVTNYELIKRRMQ